MTGQDDRCRRPPYGAVGIRFVARPNDRSPRLRPLAIGLSGSGAGLGFTGLAALGLLYLARLGRTRT